MLSSGPTNLVGKGVDNEGESWENSLGEQIDNEGEAFGYDTAGSNGTAVDNEGEDWGSNSKVNNEGEDWNSPKPSTEPEPAAPTTKPTSDPTIDLMEHLETMKKSYFCSETWENIDCEKAQSCPSGDSKGESFQQTKH